MKDIFFEANIVAANPFSNRDIFVKATMKRIRPQAPKKRSWFASHIHKPSFALIALVIAAVCSGVVYAAVNFAPALIQLLSKEVNVRGATEYTVSGFAACAEPHRPLPQRFEIKKNVTLSDDEARKIIQAKCELNWARDFAAKKWPHERVTAGDKQITTHTRVDIPGTIESVTNDTVRISVNGTTTDTKPLASETIAVIAAGEEVTMSDLKPGDIVLKAQRFTSTMPDFTKLPPPAPGVSTHFRGEPPTDLGTAALFKLSLPLDYYIEKQRYITEIPACNGNAEELCPTTPAVDVYPRNGEAPSNPHLTYDPNDIFRHISGTVTELHDDRLTLQSRAGNTYTVTIDGPGFARYNREFAPNYLPDDVTLKIGSNVSVSYKQAPDDNPKIIDYDEIMMVMVQIEAINPKSDPLEAY